MGCCSLRVEHLTLMEDEVLKFDFLGKDSIRYYNEVKVDRRVRLGAGVAAARKRRSRPPARLGLAAPPSAPPHGVPRAVKPSLLGVEERRPLQKGQGGERRPL